MNLSPSQSISKLISMPAIHVYVYLHKFRFVSLIQEKCSAMPLQPRCKAVKKRVLNLFYSRKTKVKPISINSRNLFHCEISLQAFAVVSSVPGQRSKNKHLLLLIKMLNTFRYHKLFMHGKNTMYK